jgi:hypothetical protein
MGLKAPNRLPASVHDILANADRFELLSLEPSGGPTREDGNFWGWRVLGSTVVSPETRDQLLAALERGIAENTGWRAACFIPRHSVRAASGSSGGDLVVCFECDQVHVYLKGKPSASVLVTGSPQPAFDRVLSEAGVPLARPTHAESGGAADRPSE